MDDLEAIIREKIELERWTYEKLSSHLQGLYRGRKGLSASMLKKYCNSNNIRKTSRLSKEEVDIVISGAVAKVRNTTMIKFCF